MKYWLARRASDIAYTGGFDEQGDVISYERSFGPLVFWVVLETSLENHDMFGNLAAKYEIAGVTLFGKKILQADINRLPLCPVFLRNPILHLVMKHGEVFSDFSWEDDQGVQHNLVGKVLRIGPWWARLLRITTAGDGHSRTTYVSVFRKIDFYWKGEE
jgi:hypothetical protein